jgi:hypothetical protein
MAIRPMTRLFEQKSQIIIRDLPEQIEYFVGVPISVNPIELFRNKRAIPKLPSYLEIIGLFRDNLLVRRDSMWYIHRRLSGVKTVTRIPMERARIMTDRGRTDTRCARQTIVTKNPPFSFVPMREEIVFADFIDTAVEKGFVPTGYRSGSIAIPADGASRRATLIGSLPADRASLKPLACCA